MDATEHKQNETRSALEASSQRAVHIAGALILVLVVAILIAAASGGSRWAKQRQMRGIQYTVKADLDLVLQAELKFKSQNGFYTTDLNALEIRPKKVLYAFGFVKPATFPEARSKPEWNPETRTITRLVEEMKNEKKWAAEIGLSPVTGARTIDFDRLASFCPDCSATPDHFKLVAAANLDDDAVLDVWTVDETGAIRHVLDDLQ